MGHFSSENRQPRAGREKPGGHVLTCSVFRKFWDWENLSKQLLPKLPISQSKTDLLLQQEMPTNYLLLSCHIAAAISLPASQPRGQLYQISYMRNASKPASMANRRPQGCSVTCAIPAPFPPLRGLWAARSSHGLHPLHTHTHPPPILLLCNNSVISSKLWGGQGRSKCSRKWSQTAPQLRHTALSLSTPPTPTGRGCTSPGSHQATAPFPAPQTPRTSTGPCQMSPKSNTTGSNPTVKSHQPPPKPGQFSPVLLLCQLCWREESTVPPFR